jgi:hypothetical protein
VTCSACLKNYTLSIHNENTKKRVLMMKMCKRMSEVRCKRQIWRETQLMLGDKTDKSLIHKSAVLASQPLECQFISARISFPFIVLLFRLHSLQFCQSASPLPVVSFISQFSFIFYAWLFSENYMKISPGVVFMPLILVPLAMYIN